MSPPSGLRLSWSRRLLCSSHRVLRMPKPHRQSCTDPDTSRDSRLSKLHMSAASGREPRLLSQPALSSSRRPKPKAWITQPCQAMGRRHENTATLLNFRGRDLLGKSAWPTSIWPMSTAGFKLLPQSLGCSRTWGEARLTSSCMLRESEGSYIV